MDDVFDRRPRIARAVRLARLRIDRLRRRCSVRRAGKIRADDKVFFEIDAFAVADQAIPPAGLLVFGVGVLSRRVRARGERVADEDGVRLVGVQLAERFVDDRERRDARAVNEAKAVAQHQLLRWRGDERHEPRRITALSSRAGAARRGIRCASVILHRHCAGDSSPSSRLGMTTVHPPLNCAGSTLHGEANTIRLPRSRGIA